MRFILQDPAKKNDAPNLGREKPAGFAR